MQWIKRRAKWIGALVLLALATGLVYTLGRLATARKLLAVEKRRRVTDKAYHEALAASASDDRIERVRIEAVRDKDEAKHKRDRKRINNAERLGRAALLKEWRRLKR